MPSAKMLSQVAELRHSERLVIADQSNLLYYYRIPDNGSLETGADVGFWTSSRLLIETMRHAYEEVWKGTVAIYTRRRQVSQR